MRELEEKIIFYKLGKLGEEENDQPIEDNHEPKSQTEISASSNNVETEAENNQNTAIVIDEKKHIEENDSIAQIEVFPDGNN